MFWTDVCNFNIPNCRLDVVFNMIAVTRISRWAKSVDCYFCEIAIQKIAVLDGFPRYPISSPHCFLFFLKPLPHYTLFFTPLPFPFAVRQDNFSRPELLCFRPENTAFVICSSSCHSYSFT